VLTAGLLLAVRDWPEGRGEADWPPIIAHRAGAALGPENTLAALERAMELGVDALVTDDPGLPFRDGGHLGQRAIW